MPISSAIAMRPWPWMIVASRRPRADSLRARTGAASPGTTVEGSVTVGGPPVGRGIGRTVPSVGSCSLRGDGESLFGRMLDPGGQLAPAHHEGRPAEERCLLDVGGDYQHGRST